MTGVQRRWVPTAAVAALLAVAAVAAAYSSVPVTYAPLGEPPGVHPTQNVQPPQPPAPPPRDVPPHEPSTVLKVLMWSLVALGVAAVVGLVVLLLRTGLRRLAAIRPGLAVHREPVTRPTRAAAAAQEVVAAVDSGLDALSGDPDDPRRAVIACWVRLEAAAQAAGVPRGPADTPTDLVLRLLDGYAVSRPVLDGFADVYRRARYATGTVDEPMRAAATEALRQVRADLAVGHLPAPPGGTAEGAPGPVPALAQPTDGGEDR